METTSKSDPFRFNFPIRFGADNSRDEVESIQLRLHTFGCNSEEPSGVYDVNTLKAVKIFQARFASLTGDELPISGEVDAQTFEALFGINIVGDLLELSSSYHSLMAIAQREIGVSDYKKYIIFSEGLEGVPWSVMFVGYCFSLLSMSQNKPCRFPHVSTARALWNDGSARGFSIRTSRVLKEPNLLVPGAVFVITIPGETYGQVGLIESISGMFINTIEGNSRGKGGSTVPCVARRRRSISSISPGFVNIIT